MSKVNVYVNLGGQRSMFSLIYITGTLYHFYSGSLLKQPKDLKSIGIVKKKYPLLTSVQKFQS